MVKVPLKFKTNTDNFELTIAHSLLLPCDDLEVHGKKGKERS